MPATLIADNEVVLGVTSNLAEGCFIFRAFVLYRPFNILGFPVPTRAACFPYHEVREDHLPSASWLGAA